jgi:hypothetical protein
LSSVGWPSDNGQLIEPFGVALALAGAVVTIWFAPKQG